MNPKKTISQNVFPARKVTKKSLIIEALERGHSVQEAADFAGAERTWAQYFAKDFLKKPPKKDKKQGLTKLFTLARKVCQHKAKFDSVPIEWKCAVKEIYVWYWDVHLNKKNS